ncbi:MAG: hypothetical protein AB8B55_24660 [Mariniblastus sp.]
MRRWFSILFRGRPFGGSNPQWWAGVAEAVFAAALFLTGIVLLVVNLTLAVLYSTPEGLYISTGVFILHLTISTALIGIGIYWISRLLWQVGVSAERRGAIATRAGELELLNELRRHREDLPTVPRDHFPPKAGLVFPFGLAPSPRNVWGLVTSAFFSIILVALATVLSLVVAKSFGANMAHWLPDGLWQQNRPWSAALLLIPICVTAGLAIFQFFRQLIKLTGIGPTSLEISKYPMQPGSGYQISLSQAGRVRLKLLDVTLVCEEQATFNQGTDIRTETRVVYKNQLFRRRGIPLTPAEPFQTQFELSIPNNAMHSFKSQNNRVQWKIVVTGQAKSWPRLRRNFPVSVHPLAPLETRPMAS